MDKNILDQIFGKKEKKKKLNQDKSLHKNIDQNKVLSLNKDL